MLHQALCLSLLLTILVSARGDTSRGAQIRRRGIERRRPTPFPRRRNRGGKSFDSPTMREPFIHRYQAALAHGKTCPTMAHRRRAFTVRARMRQREKRGRNKGPRSIPQRASEREVKRFKRSYKFRLFLRRSEGPYINRPAIQCFYE